MTAELHIDTREVDRLLKRVGFASADGTIPLQRLDRYLKADMGRQWNRAKASGGGTVRGEKWAQMMPIYQRETDNKIIWPWGGNPKVRGRGKVKGKKRPSGKRVKRTSIIGKDTGALYAALLSVKPNIKKKSILTIGHEALLSVEYAKTILGYDNRNILRFERPKDVVQYRKIAVAYLREIVKKARKR